MICVKRNFIFSSPQNEGKKNKTPRKLPKTKKKNKMQKLQKQKKKK